MATEDVNVFDTTEDVGAILPPRIDAPGPLASYFTRPMVPSPASRRRDTLKGIAQFIPFLSGEIAKYDDDKLGMALSSLDALGPAGTAVKGTLAIGKQAAKKGVGSLDQPKDMMFVHNTNESAIKSFDQMGGIPSPSLAVQPADVPLTGFGQIQLIAKPKNFDPAVDPRNAVYSADAYTPRAPKKIRLAKEGAAEQLTKNYKDIASKYSRGLNDMFEQGQNALRNLQKDNLYYPENRIDELERFFNSDMAKIKFLEDTGRNVDDYLEGPKSLGMVDFQAKAAALDPNSALYQSATKADEFKLTREFRDWVAKEKDKYLSQEGVFQYFDEFEQTMVTKPYTLENATENMIKETQRGGEGASGFYGPARLRALMSEKMKDLPDIKSQRPRIEDNPAFDALDVNIEDVFTEVTGFESPSDFATNIMNDVGMALEEGEDIVTATSQAIDYAGNLGPVKKDKMLNGILDAFKKNAARNVEYLEAKPMRSVGFEEFAGAIVPPRTSQEVIDILEKRGLKVIKNDPETDFMKTKARQKFKDQMFSFAPVAGAGGIAALSIEDNTPDNDKGVGSIKN